MEIIFMADLLPFKYFENLQTQRDKIYCYYDRPLLFACKDKQTNKFYIALLIDEDDDTHNNQLWMYVEISESRLSLINNAEDKITFREIFSEPENGFVYILDIDKEEVNIVQKNYIRKEWLPRL